MSLRLEDFAVHLPTEVISLYERLGITELYGWQAECLRTGVLDGSHLIYAAPTSGGKTLIAEIIILKKVIQSRLRLKSLFVLPYVSLVEEKHKHFARIARAYNRNQDLSDKIRVEAFFGDKPILEHNLKKAHIIICTIEKAARVLNSLIGCQMINKLGCVVIDEIHTMGYDFNGFHIETILSKIGLEVERGEKRRFFS